MTRRVARALLALALLAGAMLGVAMLTSRSAVAEPEPTPRRWAWMEGTVWYVPTESLPAILTTATSPRVARLLDQTVYSIDGYSGGFFWGVVRAQLMPALTMLPVAPDDSPTCMRLAGSVTPQGNLNLSFAPMTGGDRTTGVGVMQRHDNVWTMQLQMTTGETEQVTHWAYMTACPAAGRCPLPAVAGTAQAFLKPCRDVLRP